MRLVGRSVGESVGEGVRVCGRGECVGGERMCVRGVWGGGVCV